MAHKKKSEKLGMSFGTAYYRLMRDIIFDMMNQLGKNSCFQCSEPMTREEFSIEHKRAWLNSDYPKDLFFKLENIAFSHTKCNAHERTLRFTKPKEERRALQRKINKEFMRGKRKADPSYGRKSKKI